MGWPSSPIIKLPMLIAVRAAGKRKGRTKTKIDIEEGTGCVNCIDCINGNIMITIGMMKTVINSRLRVNALRSFLINAASTVENPSLPKKPVFGA